jgi:hypothetical protein
VVFYNNLEFFNKNGFQIQTKKIFNVEIELYSTYGTGAILEPITNENGQIINIDVLHSGTSYDTSNTKIVLKDKFTNSEFTINQSDITFGPNGEILSINISSIPLTLTWTYPSYYYKTFFDLGKTSVNLIENESIYVLEKVYDGVNFTYNQLKAQGTNYILEWEFDKENFTKYDDECFKFFNIDFSHPIYPIVEKFDSFVNNLQDGSTDSIYLSSNPTKYFRQINGDKLPFEIHFLASQKEEGVFYQIINLYEKNLSTNKRYKIFEAEIVFETEAEDERFQTILTNLGFQIDKNLESLMAESDINEDNIDYELLNKKRKEFILEHSNIIPYIGSYKSLFNIIKFFGYNNLYIKEYFKNVDINSKFYNKKYPVDLDKIREFKKNIVDKRYLVKTSLFGLFYKINEETGTEDEFGLPNTTYLNPFTIEEILIKLYGLKKYLQEYFMPIGTKIIDITAEGIYFERYNINSWTTKNTIFDVNPNKNIDFTNNSYSYILNKAFYSKVDYFKPAKVDVILNNGQITLILKDGGYGYLETPQIFIIGGGCDTPAIATATLTNSSISSITMVSNGSGYKYLPEVLILPEPTSPSNSVVLNDIDNYILGFFDGAKKKELEDLLSVDTENVETAARLDLKLDTKITIDDFGDLRIDTFDYTFRPAQIEAVVLPGGSIALNIIDGGKGYISPPTIIISGGSPSIPASVSSVSIVGGKVVGLTYTGGNDYSYTPIVYVIGGFPNSFYATIDSIDLGDFYEIEWKVKGQKTGWEYSIRGNILNYRNHTVYVPFNDVYDIEMICYDTSNNAINRIKKSAFEAKVPNITIRGIKPAYTFKSINDLNNTSIDLIGGIVLDARLLESTIDDFENLTLNELDASFYQDYKDAYLTTYPKFECKNIYRENKLIGDIESFDLNLNTITFKNVTDTRPEIKVGDTVWLWSTKEESDYIPAKVTSTNYLYKIKDILVDTPHPTFIAQYFKDFTTNTIGFNNLSLNKQFYFNSYPILVYPIYNTTITHIKLLDFPRKYIYDKLNNKFLKSGDSFILNDIFPLGTDLEFKIIGCKSGPMAINKFPGTSAITLLTDSNGFYYIDASMISNWNTSVPIISTGIYDDFFEVEFICPNSNYEFRPFPNEPNCLNPSGNTSASFILYVNVEVVDVYFDTNSYVLLPLPPLTDVGGFGTYSISFEDEPKLELGLSNIPENFNTFFKVYSSLENTVVLSGNQIYNDSYTNGFKDSDYLRFVGKELKHKYSFLIGPNQTIYGLHNKSVGFDLNTPISYFNSIGMEINSFVDLHQRVSLNKGTSIDEYDFLSNTQIIIYNVSSNLENILFNLPLGFSMLELNDTNYRFVAQVLNIQKVGADIIITVKQWSGDYTYLSSSAKLEFDYNLFNTKIVDMYATGSTTNIFLDLNNHFNTGDFTNYYISFPSVKSDTCLKIEKIYEFFGDTYFKVDNRDNDIYQVSKEFDVYKLPFDLKEFNKQYFLNTDLNGINQLDATIDELSSVSINDFTFKQDINCGFKILSFSNNDTLQFNNDIPYTFIGSSSVPSDILTNINLLNSITNNKLSLFDYFPDDQVNPTKIIAVSKYLGQIGLGELTTTGSVVLDLIENNKSHTYPRLNYYDTLVTTGYYGEENIQLKWNPYMDDYREFGISPLGNTGWYPGDSSKVYKQYNSIFYSTLNDIFENNKVPYLNSISGDLKVVFINAIINNFNIKPFTRVLFSCERRKFQGVKSYNWKLYDSNGILIGETVKKYFIFNFKNIGEYYLELELTDYHNNKTKDKIVIKVMGD